MSDTSRGDGWWLASDLKWYPPHLHADPDHRARFAPRRPSTSTSPMSVAPEPVPGDRARADPTTPAPSLFERDPGAAPPRPHAPLFEPGARPSPILPDHDREAFEAPDRRRRMMVMAGLALVGVIVAGLAIARTVAPDDDAPASGPARAAAPGGAQPDEPFIETDRDIATRANPAAFGETYDWGDWRATVHELVDANEAGLVADFDDPPGDGNTFVTVLYDITYTGPELTGVEPFVVSVVGTEVYEAFGCFLDDAALAERAIQPLEFELVAGQTRPQADCFEVPADEVDDLVVTLENFEGFDGEVAFAASGSPLPTLGPVEASPDYDRLDLVPAGTTVQLDTWAVSLVEVLDAEPADLLGRFSSPPRPGSRYLVLLHEVTYTGSNPSSPVDVVADALGTEVFGRGSCSLDTSALSARGVAGVNDVIEAPAGETLTFASCVQIPDDELDSFVVRIETGRSVGANAAWFVPGPPQ